MSSFSLPVASTAKAILNSFCTARSFNRCRNEGSTSIEKKSIFQNYFFFVTVLENHRKTAESSLFVDIGGSGECDPEGQSVIEKGSDGF